MAQLQEIVILPPIGIGRFGSAGVEHNGVALPDAMDNFELIDDGTAGRRAMVPAKTLSLAVESATQAISIADESVPDAIRFRNRESRIRPVAPFFEVWGAFDDDPESLRPLTKDDISVGDVSWTIEAANRKAYRRTHKAGDIVSTNMPPISGADHVLKEIEGQVGFFPNGNPIKFGHAVFIKPTDEFPEIRLRMYPAAGLIYGHNTELMIDARPTPPITMTIPPERVVYHPGTVDDAEWEQYSAGNDPLLTEPGGLERPGWFDDSCDGTINVRIGQHVANARFSFGPPDYVPQSHHVRSAADEFEQMIHGPNLPDELPTTAEARQQHISAVIRTIRSAVETMRGMNTSYLNGSFVGNAFIDERADPKRVLATHGFYLGMARQLASTDEQRFGRALAELQRLGDQLRDFMDAPDRSPESRRKMPTMMRGSDRDDLCLTVRQREYLRRVNELEPPT